MTNKDAYFLQEACGLVARFWVKAGAKPTKLYTYVNNRWVEISLQFNGEEAPPQRRLADTDSHTRRAGDKEQTESKLDALTSDRSIDA